MKKLLTAILLIFGISLVIWVLGQVGLVEMWNHVRTLGLSFLLLIPLSFIWILPNTQGFACAVNPDYKQLSFLRLMVTRLVGESINYLTPSGYLGGEPLKAALLKKQLGGGGAMGTVVVAKTAQTLALLLFIIIGVAISNQVFDLPETAQTAGWASVALLSLGVPAMVLFSTGRVSSKLAVWSSGRFSRVRFLSKLADLSHQMDDALGDFYQKHKVQFTLSTFWHFLGWSMGMVEVWVIVHLLGYDLSLFHAFLLSSVATLFMVGGFFIPGSLGAFEVGHYVAAVMVGLPPGVGITVCFARRLREVVWLFIGLLLWGLFHKKLMQ